MHGVIETADRFQGGRIHAHIIRMRDAGSSYPEIAESLNDVYGLPLLASTTILRYLRRNPSSLRVGSRS